jgi:hypothetical protein
MKSPRLKRLATAALLALATLACSQGSPEPIQVDWDLREDIGEFRSEYTGQTEMIYRVDELSVAFHSDEYRAFLQAINDAPPARSALVYYESAPNAGHYRFMYAATDGRSCWQIVSDLAGVRAKACSGVPVFTANVPADTRAIRDPGVAALIQYTGNTELPRRAMAILPHEPIEVSDDALFQRIERIFG